MGKIKPYNVHYSMGLLFSVRTEVSQARGICINFKTQLIVDWPTTLREETDKFNHASLVITTRRQLLHYSDRSKL